MSVEKEQTTIRLPAELKKQIDRLCEAKEESFNRICNIAVKRIVARYHFDGVMLISPCLSSQSSM